MENANIAGIRMEHLEDKYPNGMRHKEREHVSFCYQKISWSNTVASKKTEDDWETPVV